MKHLTLLIAVLTVSTVQVSTVQAADTPPNIIVIMADDVGYECFGCYGSKQYQTPYLDRMAAEGMKFEHCYSQPLCTPSRVKLMTGVSNVRNYSGFSILNSDQKTIGHYFQQAEYETVVAGKWQLLGADHYSKQFRGKGSWPEQAGFDHSCLWQVDKKGTRYWNPLLYIDGQNKQFDGKDDYGPTVVNDYLLQFLQQPHDKPFLIYHPMILVHDPFLPTPDSKNRKSKNKQANFEDMVQYMDRMVGQSLAKLKETGQDKNTLVLFFGDNGTHKSITSELNGVTIKGGKGNTADSGTRVPMLAWWPGTITAGQTCEHLIDFSDILPTVLEAAGQPIPQDTDGHSFLPALKGEDFEPRKSIFCYYCPRPERTAPKRFVRNHRWKLYGNGKFYDVQNDVLEKRPLTAADFASNAAAATAKKELQQALKAMPPEGQNLLKFVPNGR